MIFFTILFYVYILPVIINFIMVGVIDFLLKRVRYGSTMPEIFPIIFYPILNLVLMDLFTLIILVLGIEYIDDKLYSLFNYTK